MNSMHGVGKVITSFVSGDKNVTSAPDSSKIAKAMAKCMNNIPRFTGKATAGENAKAYQCANMVWGAGIAVGGVALCIVCPGVVSFAITLALLKAKTKESTPQPQKEAKPPTDTAREASINAVRYAAIDAKVNAKLNPALAELKASARAGEAEELFPEPASLKNISHDAAHEELHFDPEKGFNFDFHALAPEPLPFMTSAKVSRDNFDASFDFDFKDFAPKASHFEELERKKGDKLLDKHLEEFGL